MQQRLSLITLGVSDLKRAHDFYAALGLRAAPSPDEVYFYQLPGMILALWSRESLAEDTVVEDRGGWGGITLAYNVNGPDEVDAVVAEAAAAGGTIKRPGAPTVWGGYSAVFADPDGHHWEVAHNPAWTIREDGATVLSPED